MEDRWVGRGVVLYFVIATLAMIWPASTLTSRIEPRIAGLPFSLVWILFVLILSSCVLGVVYLWESKTGRLD